VNLTIRRGEKVAFVGRNGEGKTTLVKCIMGEIPFDGKLTLGHNVEIGYFAQNQAQLLDENLTVFDTIDRVAVGDIRLKIRDILGAFMFGGEASDKKVKVLSGGERSRLAMIKLLLESVNLLILDEPTNHLDMRSKDVLKEAIREFDGTVILVSHDREFLDGLVTKVYEFGGGKVKEHLGGIYDFLQSKGATASADSARSLDSVMTANKAVLSTSKDSNEKTIGGGAADYAARKEQAKAQRKLQKRVEECEKRVTQIETELRELEEWMATPTGAANPALFEQYNKLKNTLAEAEAEWEEAMMAMEG
jgi:ATP-binding cassette subfamily F protein 3